MDMSKLDIFKEWISQQSTQKALLAALAAVGVVFDPEKVNTIIAGFLVVYSLLAAFRDKS